MADLNNIKNTLKSQGEVESRTQKALESSSDLEGLARVSGANDSTARAYDELRNALDASLPEAVRTQELGVDAFELDPGQPLALQPSLIRGVGLGMSEQISASPGAGALRIYTTEPSSLEVVVANAVGIFNAQELLNGETLVEVVHTGEIDASAHRLKHRPTCPAGTSIAHHSVTAGTLGAYCQGRGAQRAGRTLVLSNNHVLADVNQATIGDDVLQQSNYDGGKLPGDVVGLLEDFVTIDFDAVNYVDCATAWVDDSLFDPRFLYMRSNAPQYYRLQAPTMPATIGLAVGKSGRTTGLTQGVVRAVGAQIRVNMGGGQFAMFADQIEVAGTQGVFSQGGDSGSLIWAWNGERNPVGLLFAGGGGSTFANPIETVLQALDVDLRL